MTILLTSFLSLLSLLLFMANTLYAWAIDLRGINLDNNLKYAPQTWLVRGIKCLMGHFSQY